MNSDETITTALGVEITGYVGPKTFNEALEDGNQVRKVPALQVYMNKSIPNPPIPGPGDDEGEEGALNVLKVYDVKWKNSHKGAISTPTFAVYRNKVNDMIGMGYRVDLKYKTIGYNTEEGDTTEIEAELYRKKGNEYVRVSLYEKGKDVTEKYTKYSFVKQGSNYTGNGSNLQLGGMACNVETDGETAGLYFNFYLPVDVETRLMNGNKATFTNDELLVRFVITSYKYMDTNKEMPYVMNDDATISWGSVGTKDTFYGKSKNVSEGEGVGKGQTLWYDLGTSALDDIAGERH